MKIIDTTRLQYDSLLQTGFMKIDDEHVSDADGYSTITKEYILGMKPLGRIYFRGLENLNYTDGTPVETPYISGGEKGMIECDEDIDCHYDVYEDIVYSSLDESWNPSENISLFLD